ncbi:ABC transporter ATP-binding protein [Actinocatenispora thailandica]|uniref:ABC transporter ATP-binding protein n=1 Tax=Actinocatenispora thailandica TaxID=227318 RepID=A0A7R7DNM6_9ACTN|nr:ABC transporter ATP-binding protein [Actinocatenispora thailandica]BCJ34790.1 ABC transporter ATP-binding protein [Actinocatenispora thailandica]
MAAAPTLRVRDLSVSFGRDGEVPAVRGVDLDVHRGQLVALLGESGSGKSVTARAILGLSDARVDAEQLRLGELDLTALSEAQRRGVRGSRISLVFQDALSALNPVLTIGDQLGELFRAHRGMSRRAARARAVELLRTVGIPGPEQRVRGYPHQFSGGMRQRILIAMAIALEPDLLIADEPTTALDVTVQAQILDLLDRLRAERDMAVLLITHDLAVVSEVADHIAVMYAGRIVETGRTEDLLSHPAHPYTQALLRSVPRPDAAGGRLYAIPGTPPVPARRPPGCPFHPRCSWAVESCASTQPTMSIVGPGRQAACHRATEVLHAAG